jgi:cell wall-associated protease
LSTSIYLETANASGGETKSNVGITFKEPYKPDLKPDPDPRPDGPIEHDSGAVVLASGEKYTDVLTASVLANELDTSLLLTQKENISENTVKEIKRLNAKMIIVIGGTDSVSKSIEDKLSQYEVRRLGGLNRYSTSVKIAEEVRRLTGTDSKAVLVSGVDFPDIISISSFASLNKEPILITETSKLTKETADVISKWNISEITIGGGYRSVSKNIEADIKLSKVSRMGGIDRYETARIISENVRKLTGNTEDMVLVDGTNFPDGICINSLANLFKAPILLTKPESLHKTVVDEVENYGIQYAMIGGGYQSVTRNTESELRVENIERIYGDNRYDTAVKISQRYSNKTRPLGINQRAEWKN